MRNAGQRKAGVIASLPPLSCPRQGVQATFAVAPTHHGLQAISDLLDGITRGAEAQYPA